MQTYGTGVLEKEVRDSKIRIDGTNATLSANVPEEKRHKGYGNRNGEEIIYTNPADLLRHGALPSFSLIRFAKVKNFIDGVYATVEETINERGHNFSRDDFLDNLEKLVSGDAQKYISAARFRETNDEPSMTIPQGFYDWNPGLTSAYRQIKILSKNPGFVLSGKEGEEIDKEVMEQIGNAMGSNEGLQKTYYKILSLYSKMTERLENTPCLFPSCKIPDQDLFQQLSLEEQSDLPGGLGKLLVEAIKEGRINFIPDAKSGLYTRQMHEITPLILRDSEEFSKFLVNDEYAKILENEFISQWAGTRHTHVGHTDSSRMLLGCCVDNNRPIIIQPELEVEPFSTSYRRMGENIKFLEETIKTKLPEVLDKKRLMNDGGRADLSIGEELGGIKLLLNGLELISKDSIHLTYEDPNAQVAVETASAWLKNLQNDPDINRNTSIFVPIIRTTDGSKQISYINVGFKTIDVKVSYEDKPSIEKNGEEMFPGFYKFGKSNFKFPVLVHREVRIPYEKLINDRKLREMLNSSFSESELEEIVQKLES